MRKLHFLPAILLATIYLVPVVGFDPIPMPGEEEPVTIDICNSMVPGPAGNCGDTSNCTPDMQTGTCTGSNWSYQDGTQSTTIQGAVGDGKENEFAKLSDEYVTCVCKYECVYVPGVPTQNLPAQCQQGAPLMVTDNGGNTVQQCVKMKIAKSFPCERELTPPGGA